MIAGPVLSRPAGGASRWWLAWTAIAFLIVLLRAFPAAAQGGGPQLFLESDDLIYNYDDDIISAVGNVVARYDGYLLTADRLTYYQTTGRLVAVGNVTIVAPDGTLYEAAQADVTDDFSAGFIEQLFVATADRTFFTADRAERFSTRVTEFSNATYTACEIRFDEATRPPLWNVRAARIIHNEEERMIYFERARLEFLGVPVAFIPRLSTPDPTVTRKTGFLFPDFSLSNTLGFGVGIPFFWAIAPNYDLTVTPTFFSNAGFLNELEWRHRTRLGTYTVDGAIVAQWNPGPLQVRGGVRTRGELDLGRFWTFGWDATWQTDRTFSADYGTLNPSGSFITSQVYVEGLNDQAFLEARVLHFRDVRSPVPEHDQTRQAVVWPTVDHDVILDQPVLGGEVRFTGNATVLSRGENDPFTVGPDTFYYGLAGTTARVSEEVSWRREIIGPLGQVFTPFGYVRGDLYVMNLTDAPPGVIAGPVAARAIGAIGLDWAWPFLITTGQSAHIIEPIIQIIGRTGEQHIGQLPNDDAQSVVLDTTNLLAWDRFTGWDRAEGGSRLTLALRYTGTFGGGSTVEAIVGQSFHLGGPNSFAIEDIRNGAYGSGLEGRRSDLVAGVTATGARGNSLALSGRFDAMTYALERGSITGNLAVGPVTASAAIAYDRSRLDLGGDPATALELVAGAEVAIGPNWTLSGGIGYDFVTGTVLSNYIGIAYECDCASMSIRYSESREPGSPDVNRTILFGLQLRTLGDFDLSQR
ncbi:MAG: LPS-assembly protein LptD [Bauldia sp.]|nr:LPS-assembly protein LptD [Bauldia sp.]